MFNLSEKYEVDRKILKCDYIPYSPSEISTINTPNSQININIPKEDSAISLLNSYIILNFDVLKAATSNRYVDADDIRLINLGPNALFSNYRLTTSSGKHLESIDHAHIVCLMYNMLSSSRDSDDLSIGFDRCRDRRKRELNNNKTQKGKNHLGIYLKDVFGFAEHQQVGTFGMGYRLILTRNTVNAVLNKDNATIDAKIVINSIEWYVPHYVPSLEKYNKIQIQIKQKTPTNLHYPEGSVFMKEVNTQNFWTFELGTHEGVNVPIWMYKAFQQHDNTTGNTIKT